MAHDEAWYDRWRRPRFTLKSGHLHETEWGWAVSYPELLQLGFGVDIGYGTYIHAGAGIRIEDYVEIGGGCKLYSVDSIGGQQGPIVIEAYAKIGANSVILPGVVIGEHAVVGALSLVVTDVPAYATYGGVPAKPIR